MTTNKTNPPGASKRRMARTETEAATPRDELAELERAHLAAASSDAGMQRTAAARAARKFKGEERRAAQLASRGWTVIPPAGTDVHPTHKQAQLAALLRSFGWTVTPPLTGQMAGQADMLTDLTPADAQPAPADQVKAAAVDLAARIATSQQAAGVIPVE